MGSLFPVFQVPSALAEEVTQQEKYRPSLAFDASTGEFILDGAGRMQYGSGYDAWVLWCLKTIQTQRWAHLAYRSNIGTETSQAFALSDRAAQESYFLRTITEALLADPKDRTVRVYEFHFLWETDTVSISCTILGQNGDSASITAKL